MKLKKWLACLLACVSAFSMFACGDDETSSSSSDATSSEESGSTTGIPDAKNPQDDYIEVQAGQEFLHEVNVDYNSPANSTFIKNEKSDYKFVLGDSTAKEGMGLVSRHVTLKTGCILPEAQLSSVNDLSENSTYIFFGCEDLYKQAFGEDSMPDYDKIAHTGYSIKTYGKNVFVQAYGLQGYQLGAICLLRQLLGFDVISTNVTIYEKDGSVLPKMDILERPDYDYRQIDKGKILGDTTYGFGLTDSNSLFMSTGYSWMHNVIDYIGYDKLLGRGDPAVAEEHPYWFSEDLDRAQACFTARGDKAEYELMVQKYADHALATALKNPTVDNVVIGQMDVIGGDRDARCGCDACDASVEHYGTLAGAMLSFINDVSKKVDEYLASPEGIAEHGENRILHILMLVYGQAIRPPVEMTENGTYAQDSNGFGIPRERVYPTRNADGGITLEPVIDPDTQETQMLVAGENVEFFYAGASASYVHTFDEPENDSFSAMVEGWAGLGGSFYIWAYEINFFNYMYPYNSYDSMLGNMKYFKKIGAAHLFYQGMGDNTYPTAFDTLRTYICSKGLFDTSVKFEDVVRKFFKYQFGPAGEIMEKYFWEVTQHLRSKESITGGGIHSNQLTKTEVWPEGLIRHWMTMFEQAWQEIEGVKKTDPELWKVYDINLTAESFFPRFVLCTEYANSFTRTELMNLRTAFRDDFLYKCGNVTHKEHHTIDALFSTWEFND